MPVIDAVIDRESLTLTLVAHFDAAPRDVFAVYADPRRLERVWGPPTHPATFVAHELAPGRRSTYYMTGPDGTRYPGWWTVRTVDAPASFAFDDGFADEHFNALPGMPVAHSTFRFSPVEGGTRAEYASTYDTADALDQALDSGLVEGLTSAINQVDGVIAAFPVKHQVQVPGH